MNATLPRAATESPHSDTPARAEPPVIPADALRLGEDAQLASGAYVHLRAIRADDVERLRAFHSQLSPESITYRFFRYVPELSRAEAMRFTGIDYDHQMALVATQGGGDDERILAVVRYVGLSADTAEVAFVVMDAWQGHGLASMLFRRLASYARVHGFTTFVAVTMATNSRMLGLFRHCGYPETLRYQDGEYEVRLDITAAPLDGAPPEVNSLRVRQ